MAQIAQNLVEALELSLQATSERSSVLPAFESARHQVRHAIGAHALAARIVDRRRHAFELPGEVERHADRRQGDQEEG